MKRGRSCVHLSIFRGGGGTGGRPESKMEISIFAGVIVQRLHCIVDQYLHQNRDNISLPKLHVRVRNAPQDILQQPLLN